MTAKTAATFQHLPLFDVTKPWQTEVYQRRIAVNVILANNATDFRADFREWLEDNWHVWEAFRDQADRIWDRGRRHYSARTIGEWMRHETAMRQAAGSEPWKLNDHYWPYLARLYMLINPERAGFFEVRRQS